MVCTVEYYFYKIKTTQKFCKLSGCIYVVKYINIDRKDTPQIQDSSCFVEGGQRSDKKGNLCLKCFHF